MTGHVVQFPGSLRASINAMSEGVGSNPLVRNPVLPQVPTTAAQLAIENHIGWLSGSESGTELFVILPIHRCAPSLSRLSQVYCTSILGASTALSLFIFT